MKNIIRVLVFFMGVVFLGLGVLGALAPKEFSLEREIIINRSRADVFSSLKLMRNHVKWNAWLKKDPNVKVSFEGLDGTPGFKMFWTSENDDVGTAEQLVTKVLDGFKVETKIFFVKPFEASFDSYFILDDAPSSHTKVFIGMRDEMEFPQSAVSYLFNDLLGNKEKIIKDMDDTLINMKTVLENH